MRNFVNLSNPKNKKNKNEAESRLVLPQVFVSAAVSAVQQIVALKIVLRMYYCVWTVNNEFLKNLVVSLTISSSVPIW